jgi:hypothetical protein
MLNSDVARSRVPLASWQGCGWEAIAMGFLEHQWQGARSNIIVADKDERNEVSIFFTPDNAN